MFYIKLKCTFPQVNTKHTKPLVESVEELYINVKYFPKHRIQPNREQLILSPGVLSFSGQEK